MRHPKKRRKGVRVAEHPFCRSCSGKSTVFLQISSTGSPSNKFFSEKSISSSPFWLSGDVYKRQTQSRAESEEAVKNVISGVGDFLKSEAPDFILMEEVDKNATRSYHYEEEAALRNMLEGYDSTFTVNFDSPYLCLLYTSFH